MDSNSKKLYPMFDSIEDDDIDFSILFDSEKSESFLYDNGDFYPKTADEIRIQKLTNLVNKWLRNGYK